MNAIDIGIDEQERLAVAEGLKRLLADSYTLYLQTHNFHWNVTGPQFRELHLMFEEHYTELATAVDEIAERIRTLGVPAPGTYKEFAVLSSIEEIGAGHRMARVTQPIGEIDDPVCEPLHVMKQNDVGQLPSSRDCES